MIVARTVLGQLVRETVLSSARTLVSHDPETPYVVPSLKRQLALEDIGKRFASVDCHASQYLGFMFSAAKDLRPRAVAATANINNTARNRGASNAAASPATGSPPGVIPKEVSGAPRAPGASFMGTARGAATPSPEDTVSPRVPASVATLVTLRGGAASPVPAPTSTAPAAPSPHAPGSPLQQQWRAPDVWKGVGPGADTLSGSPSSGSVLRDRVAAEASTTPKSGSGREDPSKRHSRVMLPKDIAAALKEEESGHQRSGSFSNTPGAATLVPPNAPTPKLDLSLGARRGTGPVGKEPVVKPPSPNPANVPQSSTPTSPSPLSGVNPAPLGGAGGWKPAVTKIPVAKP